MKYFIYPIASSSKGNCVYIGNGVDDGILLDCGVGPRIFAQSLQLAGIAEKSIKAVFITHEHSDHISGLELFAKYFRVPIYGSRDTLEAILERKSFSPAQELKVIDRYEASVGGLAVGSFCTSHDCADGRGYIVSLPSGKRAAFCTDTGFVTPAARAAVLGCESVYLESNYDPDMLENGEYPQHLKVRISGKRGHLSNYDCARFARELLEGGARQLILAHLSENNNLPELALKTTAERLERAGAHILRDYLLEVAPVRGNGKRIEL